MTAPSGSHWREAIRLCWPREHGSWSLALEPLALGLIAAPSAAGFILAAAVLAGFFVRRPLRLALAGREDPRRRLAVACVVVLGAAAAAGLAAAAAFAGAVNLWPLLLGVPPGVAFIWLDSRGEARVAGAEVAGVCAFAVVPAGLAAAAGWPLATALALAATMAGRSVPAVMAIRAYLRRHKGQPITVVPALAAAATAVIAAVLLAGGGLAPWTAPLMMAVFLVRTAVLLGWRQPRWSAHRVGIAESVLGGVLVIVLAISWFRY